MQADDGRRDPGLLPEGHICHTSIPTPTFAALQACSLTSVCMCQHGINDTHGINAHGTWNSDK